MDNEIREIFKDNFVKIEQFDNSNWEDVKQNTKVQHQELGVYWTPKQYSKFVSKVAEEAQALNNIRQD